MLLRGYFVTDVCHAFLIAHASYTSSLYYYPLNHYSPLPLALLSLSSCPISGRIACDLQLPVPSPIEFRLHQTQTL